MFDTSRYPDHANSKLCYGSLIATLGSLEWHWGSVGTPKFVAWVFDINELMHAIDDISGMH